MIIVGRAINGISINGDEYLLDANGKEMEFRSQVDAEKYLMDHGITEEELDDYNFYEKDELDAYKKS